MVAGFLKDDALFIPVDVGWQLGMQSHVAMIDTGFDGDIKVSWETAKEIGLDFLYTESVKLADGNIRSMPACSIFVLMDGLLKTVTAPVCEGETVVGLGLFQKYASIVAFHCEQKWVTIEHAKELL